MDERLKQFRDFPKDKPLRIVFMGTPDFAVPTLEHLIASRHEVVAVYTQPDRVRSRGNKVTPSPVKKVAVEAGIPVFQPEKMACKASFERFQSDAPDLAVVVAYGKILRKRALALPPLGCINCHASILPYYRGAAPLFWAVANGEQSSGITTMFMDEGMDTGDMLLKQEIALDENETTGTLHDRLSEISASLLMKTLDGLLEGKIEPTKQNHDDATHAPMLAKHDFHVDFSLPAAEVAQWIRACSPFPGAKATLNDGTICKIFSPTLSQEELAVGHVRIKDSSYVIGCGSSSSVEIQEIQWPGKKRMSVADFQRGKGMPENLTFLRKEST